MSYPIVDSLMQEAYRFWTEEHEEYSWEEFVEALPKRQQVATVVGNLNYQVENGGFIQWAGNGYISKKEILMEALQEINKSSTSTPVKKVLRLLEAFLWLYEQIELNGYDADSDKWQAIKVLLDLLDSDYYSISDSFLACVETYLTSLTNQSKNENLRNFKTKR